MKPALGEMERELRKRTESSDSDKKPEEEENPCKSPTSDDKWRQLLEETKNVRKQTQEESKEEGPDEIKAMQDELNSDLARYKFIHAVICFAALSYVIYYYM